MGKTFRKLREEGRGHKNKTATREEKTIDKHRKYIYNSVSSEDDDVDDDFDDTYYETNHTKSIHRK
jgi:hypothetical protein